MERHDGELTKIMPCQHRTLLECVIASFEANGPMTDEELYRTLPHFNKIPIREMAAILPDELTGR